MKWLYKIHLHLHPVTPHVVGVWATTQEEALEQFTAAVEGLPMYKKHRVRSIQCTGITEIIH